MEKKQKQSSDTVNKRINKKHFIIYNNGGVISATTPKNWARANQNLFPNFNFTNSDNTPTVDAIELFLEQNNFNKIENKEIVIMYNYLSL
jgi:hypothetical protein